MSEQQGQTPRNDGWSVGPGTEDTGVDLLQYWRMVLSHLWLVVIVTAVVTVGTTLWTVRQPRIYRAQASVAIEVATPKVLDDVREVVELQSNAWNSRSYMTMQLAILKSRETALEISERLASDPTFVPISERDNAMKWLPGYVRDALRPALDKDTNMLLLAVEDLVPERAARLANVAADVFVERNLNYKMEATEGANNWLVDQVDELQGKLEASEVSLQRFKEDNDILSATFEDRQSINSSDLLALSKALTELRLRKVEVELRVKQLERAQSGEKRYGARGLPVIIAGSGADRRPEFSARNDGPVRVLRQWSQ